MKSERRLAGLTIVLLLGAFMADGAAAQTREPIRVTQAVNATDNDPNPSRTYSSPVIAADPQNPRNIVAAAAEIRSRTCGLLRSSDGGQTWERPDGAPTSPDYPFCFQTETGPPQAVVAFGRNSQLYYAYAGYNVADTLSDWPIGRGGGWRGNVSPIVSRSSDFGGTWSTTVVRDARGLKGEDQENNRPVSSIAVDTTTSAQDLVYVGWKATYRDGGRELPLIATSTNGAESFSEPVDLTAGYFEDDANRQRLAEGAELEETPSSDKIKYYWPDLTLDNDGTIYAVWNARFGPGPQMDDTGAFLSRSTDGGQTFTVTELSPAPETYRYPMLSWSDLGGAKGTLHLVYEAETSQEIAWVHDVYYERSTDGGSTWSAPVRLSDDGPDELTGQYHPDVAISSDGRVDVSWWDFRNNNGNFANDVYLASSRDNGETWSDNVRVTDQSISRRLGVWYNNADIRQAPGMVASDAFTVLAWDDTRNGDEASQTQDIYSAAVQWSPIEADIPKALRYGLAVAIGLSVLGLAFWLLAVISKRRKTPSTL